MPSPIQVTITSTCNTSNNSARLSPSGNNEIQWQATGQNSYVLTLPQGVFVGYPGTGTFTVNVVGTGFQPGNCPLQLVASPAAQTISNYISQNGSNCPDTTGDPPPEIVIDAS